MTLERLTELYFLKIYREQASLEGTAKMLGISIRTVRNYLKKFGLKTCKDTRIDAAFDIGMKNLTPSERDFYESLDRI